MNTLADRLVSCALGSLLAAGLAACTDGADGADGALDDVVDDEQQDEARAIGAAADDGGNLRIRFAGDASGEVVVKNDTLGQIIASCTASCSVPVPAGDVVELVALTPSTFGGWGGNCTGSDLFCSFTMPARATARPTFNKAPGEEWTLILPDGVAVSADFDPDGDLVVGTTAGLHKVSAGGVPIWFQGAVAGEARADPNGDIFAVAGQELIKVNGEDGAVLWTRDLGSGGCSDPPRMGHVFETGPGGDVAIQHGATLRVFSGAGTERWSASISAARCVVAINAQGVVHTGIEDPESIEPTSLGRFTADGVALAETDWVTPQYQFAMAFDSADFLLASSAGHGHVDVMRWTPGLERVYWNAVDNFDPDWVENGVAADATEHAVWAFGQNENSFSYFEGVVAHWIGPDGTIEHTVTKASRPADDGHAGVRPHDVAADDGNFVLVGEFGADIPGPTMVGGWVQAYRP